MTTLETLKAARKLITPVENWTREVFASNRLGDKRGPLEDDAACWCASGAISKCSGMSPLRLSEGSHIEALGYKHVASLATFNDTHTHAEVLAAFDAAIAKLSAPEEMFKESR